MLSAITMLTAAVIFSSLVVLRTMVSNIAHFSDLYVLLYSNNYCAIVTRVFHHMQSQNHVEFCPILHSESLKELIRCPFQHLTMVYLNQLMWLFQLDIALNHLFKYVNV